MNNNTVIYARYSSHSQNEQSIETQIKVCRDYAEKHNLNVIDIYYDKAKTGTNDNREYFQKMIDDSNKKIFKYVLVYNLSRFARNTQDSVMNEIILEKNGVNLISAYENISGDDDDPVNALMKNMMRGVNEYYSKYTAKNIRDGLKTNAMKGLSIGGRSLPLGYKSNDEREIYVDEEEAKIVKKIFEMFKDKKTYADIIRYLNLHNVKTKIGNEFNKSSIKRILTNKKYIGVYIYKNEVMPKGIPSIISKSLFDEVQEMIKARRKAPGKARSNSDYILTGKLYCGNCKESMVGQSSTSKTKAKYYYYICKGRLNKKCSCNRIGKDKLEDFIFEKTREILTTENIDKISKKIVEFANDTKQGQEELKRLKKEYKKLEKEKQSLLDSLKLSSSNSIKITIMEEMENVDDSLNELGVEILRQEANQFNITQKEVKFFLQQMRHGKINDIKYRKMLINTFVNEIYLYDDGRVMIIFNVENSTYNGTIPPSDNILSSFKSEIAPPLANLFELFELLYIIQSEI